MIGECWLGVSVLDGPKSVHEYGRRRRNANMKGTRSLEDGSLYELDQVLVYTRAVGKGVINESGKVKPDETPALKARDERDNIGTKTANSWKACHA